MLRIGDFVLLGATKGRLAASLATWPCPASIQMSHVFHWSSVSVPGASVICCGVPLGFPLNSYC